MFGFKLKSTFFENLRPGDLVKVTRYGIVTLFVFSRYDSDRQHGLLWWRKAKVRLNNDIEFLDEVVEVRGIIKMKNTTLYQENSMSTDGNFELVTDEKLIKRYNDAYDRYFTNILLDGRSIDYEFEEPTGIDNCLSRFQLINNPPEYLCAKCKNDQKIIFKFGGAVCECSKLYSFDRIVQNILLNFKECALIGDAIEIADDVNIPLKICYYDNLEWVREATVDERSLLILKEMETLDNQYKISKQSLKSDLQPGTLLYIKLKFSKQECIVPFRYMSENFTMFFCIGHIMTNLETGNSNFYTYNNEQDCLSIPYDECSVIRRATQQECKKFTQYNFNKKINQFEIFRTLPIGQLLQITDYRNLGRTLIFKYDGITNNNEDREINIKNFVNIEKSGEIEIESTSVYIKISDEELENCRRLYENEEKFYNKCLDYYKTCGISAFNKADIMFNPLADHIKLKPFVTKVLVSNGQNDFWRPAIFGCVIEKEPIRKYMIVGGETFRYCILYNKFKNLAGKRFEYKS